MSKIWLIAGAGAVLLAGVIGVLVMEEGAPEMPFSSAQKIKKDLKLQDWHEFSSPHEDFKVLIPSLPQHASEIIKDPKTQKNQKYDVFVSEADDGTVFMITLITPLEGTDEKSEDLLNRVIQDLSKASEKSKILKKKTGVYKGYPSIDFSIENPQVTVNGKAFVKDKTLYMLSSVTKAERYAKEEVDFFINSFQLTSGSMDTTPSKPITPVKKP